MASHMAYPSPVVSLCSHSNPTSIPQPIGANNRRTVAFTTPRHYAHRLSHLISLRQWTPIWSPTVTVESTPLTNSNLLHFLRPLPSPNQTIPKSTPLDSFSSIAFTSRAGITAFHEALTLTLAPPLSPSVEPKDFFTICALGKDAELLNDNEFIGNLCGDVTVRRQVRVLVPPVASPTGLIESLGPGHGRKVLCPVPRVVGLEEPPVVPDFLRGLRGMGWDVVRVDAYETKWVGPECVEKLMGLELLDAIVFTSTAEVEGMLKGLREFGLSWADFRRNGVVVAAHGPVTAAGAERVGVNVDIVSSKFESFNGVVEALANAWDEM